MLEHFAIHLMIFVFVIIGLCCVFVPFFMDMNDRINNENDEFLGLDPEWCEKLIDDCKNISEQEK